MGVLEISIYLLARISFCYLQVARIYDIDESIYIHYFTCVMALSKFLLVRPPRVYCHQNDSFEKVFCFEHFTGSDKSYGDIQVLFLLEVILSIG